MENAVKEGFLFVSPIQLNQVVFWVSSLGDVRPLRVISVEFNAVNSICFGCAPDSFTPCEFTLADIGKTVFTNEEDAKAKSKAVAESYKPAPKPIGGKTHLEEMDEKFHSCAMCKQKPGEAAKCLLGKCPIMDCEYCTHWCHK